MLRFHLQGAKLVYYLYELLWRHLDKLSRVQRGEVDDVMDVLQHLGLSPLRLGTRISPNLRGSLEEVGAEGRGKKLGKYILYTSSSAFSIFVVGASS